MLMKQLTGGTVGGGGVKVMEYTLTGTSTSTAYDIPTGLSSISKFVMYAFFSSENSGYMFAWDSTDSSHYSGLAGGDYNSNTGYCKKGVSINDSSTTRLGSIVSVNGGTIKYRTPSNASWSPSTITFTIIAIP